MLWLGAVTLAEEKNIVLTDMEVCVCVCEGRWVFVDAIDGERKNNQVCTKLHSW